MAEYTDGKRPKRQKKQRRRDPEFSEKRRNGRKGFSIAIMIIALVLAFLVMCVGFITDWMWFKDLGYTSVFWKRLLTQLELGVPVFVVVTLLARFYLRTLKNGYFKKIESHEIPNLKRINSTSWILSIIFGLGIGMYTSTGTWLTFLKSKYSSEFGLKDPLFNLDIGFYIFNLDWLDKVNEIVLVSVIGLVVVTVVYYMFLLSVRTPDIFDNEDDDLPPEPEFEEEEEDAEPKVIYRTPIDHSVIGRMGRSGQEGCRSCFRS